MITTTCQRWRDRRDSYRPVGETIDTRHYEVALIGDDTSARRFVEQHHYSGTYPAARLRIGLFEGVDLVGVAVLSQPMSSAVLSCLPDPPGGVELGRFVLLDRVPANGESWFLGRVFELARATFSGIVSFSDPMPRRSQDRVVFGGHVGTIYQATNGVYLGRTDRRTLRLLPDGSVLSARAISKIRSGERGWRYASEILERHGADAPGTDLRGWLAEWLPRLTRTVRHTGNHRYVWALDRAGKKRLPKSLSYPKFTHEVQP